MMEMLSLIQPNDYNDLLDKYLPYDAYYKDDNGKPLVSSKCRQPFVQYFR